MHTLTVRRRFGAWCLGLSLLAATTGLGAVLIMPAVAATPQVVIDNFAFAPNELTVQAGTTVVFRNHDDMPHLVVGAKGDFRSKVLDTDDSFSFTFAKAGTYDYFCGMHPYMQGKIVVTP